LRRHLGNENSQPPGWRSACSARPVPGILRAWAPAGISGTALTGARR